MRETNPTFFKNITAIQNTGATITLEFAVFWLLPLIGDEDFAIERTHRCSDAILQTPKVIF